MDIGRNDKNMGKNDKYLAIKGGLESKEVWVEIEFLLTIKPVFDEFMTKFQREETNDPSSVCKQCEITEKQQ